SPSPQSAQADFVPSDRGVNPGIWREWRPAHLRLGILPLALLLWFQLVPAQAQGGGGRTLPTAAARVIRNVGLDQKMDAQVPRDVTFRDEAGRVGPLRRYFGRKPVMLNLIQYRCKMLCSEEMKILAQSLKELKFTAGKQFEIVTLSIDHREGPELA